MDKKIIPAFSLFVSILTIAAIFTHLQFIILVAIGNAIPLMSYMDAVNTLCIAVGFLAERASHKLVLKYGILLMVLLALIPALLFKFVI